MLGCITTLKMRSVRTFATAAVALAGVAHAYLPPSLLWFQVSLPDGTFINASKCAGGAAVPLRQTPNQQLFDVSALNVGADVCPGTHAARAAHRDGTRGLPWWHRSLMRGTW